MAKRVMMALCDVQLKVFYFGMDYNFPSLKLKGPKTVHYSMTMPLSTKHGQ